MNCFRTLEDLVFGYQHPHKGLVSPLLYGVPRDVDIGDESSGAPPMGDSNYSPLFNTQKCTFKDAAYSKTTHAPKRVPNVYLKWLSSMFIIV